MHIQALNYASPKNYNSNEPSPPRIVRANSDRFRSIPIAAFDDFAHRSARGERGESEPQLAYSQSDLYIGLSPSSSPPVPPPTKKKSKNRSKKGNKHFVNFDGTPNNPEWNAVQYVRPSMYMFPSSDNDESYGTPRSPSDNKVRWKSSQQRDRDIIPQHDSRPPTRSVGQQTNMFLPELSANDSAASLIQKSPRVNRSTFKHASNRVVNPRLRFKKTKTPRRKNYSDNSDLAMNATMIRARMARQLSKRSIQYTGRASRNMLQTQMNSNASNSSSENINENEIGNSSSRLQSSRSVSPLDESHYQASLAAKNREMARIRAAAAVKMMKRNKNNPEQKVPKTDRNKYRNEKIKSLTDLNTKLSDQKFKIWSHILTKESWNNEKTVIDSQWFALENEKSSKASSRDIEQIQTLINGKDSRQFFKDLKRWNQM